MSPERRAIMSGKTAWTARKTLLTLMSTIRSHASGSPSATEPAT